MHELRDLSSAKQARIASEEEAKRPLGNRTKNTLTITERKQTTSQKMSWSIKQTEILTGGLTHAQPLDALGYKARNQ